jgi:hypothetical protein
MLERREMPNGTKYRTAPNARPRELPNGAMGEAQLRDRADVGEL